MVRPPSPMSAKQSAVAPLLSSAVDIRQWLIVLRAHFWVAAGLTLVLCTLATWQQLRRPKLYAAHAALYLERGNRMQEIRQNMDLPIDDLQLATRLEQLKSPEMIQRVVASLTPEETALVLGPAPAGVPRANPAALPFLVRSAVVAQRRPGTMLLSIDSTHRDPRAAALLANRFAEQFIRYVFDRSLAGNDAALAFLKEQAEEMRKKVEAAERELQDYRQRYHLVSLEANQNIIVDNLKTLNAGSTSARVARLAAEARLAQAQDLLKREAGAEQLASATGFEGLADLAKRLADLQAKRAVMAERYGRRHPAMQEAEREIEALDRLRVERVQGAIASLRDQCDKARAVETQLAEQLALAEKEALHLDQIGVEYNTLRRAAESYRATFTQILTRLNEATMSAQLGGVNLKISELASPPAVPFSPNTRQTLLFTLALGVVVFFGYPFTMELFFGRVRSVVDVEHFLGCDVLGEIGTSRGGKDADRSQLVRSGLDENATEQFRALYSQLVLNSKFDPPKTILVTSTIPSEGKSFIAANLSALFVAHGRRVLLIDGDFRRPAQHRNFQLPNNAGLLSWLAREETPVLDPLQDPLLGIVEVSPGLHLLRTGGLSRKATELLASGRLSPLLTQLQLRFDVLVIDTPPAGVFPDAIAFAQHCQELVFVCRFNTVSRQAVRHVLDRLRQAELELPGVVLNAMPAGFGGSTYYYGYSYHQAKGYAKAYTQPPAQDA